MPAAIATPSCVASENEQVVLLCVTGDEGEHTQYRLELYATVVIGSSRQCGLSLSGDDVSRLHCSLRWDQNGIWLKEWGASDGTFLDGERITGEAPVEMGSTIRVGTYSIRLRFDEPQAPQQATLDQHTAIAATTATASAPALPTKEVSPLADTTISSTVSKAAASAAPQLVRKTIVPTTFEMDLVEAACESGDRETFDMLRAEVEQLQFELAERDAQLAEALAEEHESETPEDGASANQLLGRLEELLAELDRSDERMATLEDLLRMAEEANSDAREERQQMESWLGDIESVFGEREATWDAEIAVLRDQTATLAAERDQLLQQLTQPALVDKSEQSPEDTARLQLQIKHLQQQLHEVKAAEACNREELRRCESQLAEAAEAKNALREEQLKLAEERAFLSRLRAEVATEQADRQERPQNALTDIDDRVRGLRQHLREIHEEEKQEHCERSLPSRIAQLWRRVEGHR